MRASLAISGAILLSGCSWLPGFVHRQEGGEIAKPLPPTPGENRPYPNLASVPPRPTPPNQAELQKLSQSLIADRENASHELMPAPADPSLPSTSPGLFGVGTAPPPPPIQPTPGASASLAAASAPPQPAAPAPAPQKTAAAKPSVPAPAAPSPAAPPALPPGPPAPPVVASLNPQPGPGTTPFPGSDYGGSPPGAATAAHSPAQPPFAAVAAPAPPTGVVPVPPASRARVQPPPTGPGLPTNPATTVLVNFSPGSAVLPADAASALRALAAKRGQHPIAVTGHGDANGLAPKAQSQAVSLGLQRAEAIAQALAADGVPENAIIIASQATGRGGSARIVE